MSHHIIHRVPEYDDAGERVVRMRHFPLMTPAKEFARDQARVHGHKGWTIESMERDYVAELLAEHAPIPDRWTD